MKLKGVIFNACVFVEIAALSLLAGLTFSLDVDVPTDGEEILFQPAVLWAKRYSTWLGVSLFSVLALTKTFRWLFKPSSKEQCILERQAKDALDRFRNKVFPEIRENEPDHYNRVTLFKKVTAARWISPRRGPYLWPWGWRWPWSGWLVIACRSGHVTQNSSAGFLIADDGKAEGIAGCAYHAGALRATGLPSLSEMRYYTQTQRVWLSFRNRIRWTNSQTEDYAITSNAVRDYARDTRSSQHAVWQRMKAGKPCPTSILGVRIDDSKGNIYGVVVIDSANDIECIDSNDRSFQAAWTKLRNRLIECGVIP